MGAPEKPPTWEDVRKGDQVFRKGLPAEIVKIDNEIYPPSFVVRMVEGGNEVSTDGANISLGIGLSMQCIRAEARVCMVNLRQRPDLNGRRGIVLNHLAETNRWNVLLDGDSEPISANPKNMSLLLSSEVAGQVDNSDQLAQSELDFLRQHAAMMLREATESGKLRGIYLEVQADELTCSTADSIS